MQTQDHVGKKSKNNSSTEDSSQSENDSALQMMDNRSEAIQMQQLQELSDNSSQVNDAVQLQSMADNFTIEKEPLQRKENKTGLPDNLKTGMESLSGISLDSVNVHRNSDRPAQLNAYAYAQGTDIHLGSGQEKHLPHELGHVVQQAQGKVKPTKSVDGIPLNDNAGLEKEADVMGAKASENDVINSSLQSMNSASESVSQLKEIKGKTAFNDLFRTTADASSQEGKKIPAETIITFNPEENKNNFYKSKLEDDTPGFVAAENVIPDEEKGISGAAEAEALGSFNDATLGSVDLAAGKMEKDTLKEKYVGHDGKMVIGDKYNEDGKQKTDLEKSKGDDAKQVEKEKGAMDSAVGIGSSIVGFVGMIQGIKGMLKAGPTWEGAMAGEGFLESSAGAVGGIAKTIDSVDKAGGGAGNAVADTTSKVTEGITGGLTALKNTAEGFYKLWHAAGETGDLEEGVDGVTSLFKAAKSCAEVAKTVYDIIGEGIPVSLLTTIPAISIVISFLDIFMRAADFYGGAKNSDAMDTTAQELYDKFTGEYGGKLLFRKYKAGTWGFRKTYIRPNEEVITSLNNISKEINGSENSGNIDPSQIIFSKCSDGELLKVLKSSAGIGDLKGDEAVNKFNEIRIQIQSYETADKLFEINNKRATGAVASIAVEVTKVISTLLVMLTSPSPVAVAGLIMKGALAAGGAGRAIGKFAQDKYRNSKGDEHGSDAKTVKYVQHIRNIYELFEYSHDKQDPSILERAKSFLSATGVKTGLFYAESDSFKQSNMLLEAMRKR